MHFKRLLTVFALICPFMAYGQNINGDTSLHDLDFPELEVNGNLRFKNLHVEEGVQVNGTLSGKKLECKNIAVNGSAHISKVKTIGLQVNGSLSGNSIEAQTLEVDGSLDAKNFSVATKMQVNGEVEAVNATIGDCYLTSQEATFVDSKVASILVKDTKTRDTSFWSFIVPSKPSPQVITLKGSTVVSGDIEFEKEGGEVHIFDNAVVNGKITSGTTVKK